MNYASDTSPTYTPRTAAELTTITGTPIQAATSVNYSPTQNTDVSLLSITPDLSAAQTSITFTTPHSATTDALVVEFAINVADLIGGQTVIPPGIWDMTIHAKANANSDINHVGLRFWVIGRTSGGAYTKLTTNGSDIEYLFQHEQPQDITLSLVFATPVDISSYASIHVVVVSHNQNNQNRRAVVYFQSSATYSHIHTSFSVPGTTGPTGPTGPTGTTGPTGYTGNTGPIGSLNTTVQPVSFFETGVPINWTLGPNAVFDGSEVSANFRIYLTNLPTTQSQLYDLTLIINQSTTGYYASSMNINGDNVTFGFLNDTAPTPQASKVEIQKFKILYGGEGFVFVFSELQSYYALPPPP